MKQRDCVRPTPGTGPLAAGSQERQPASTSTNNAEPCTKHNFIEREAAAGRKDVDGIPDAVPSSVPSIGRPPSRSSGSKARSQQRPLRTQQEAGGAGALRGGPTGQEKSRPTARFTALFHCAVCQHTRAHTHTHSQHTYLCILKTHQLSAKYFYLPTPFKGSSSQTERQTRPQTDTRQGP